MVAFIAQSHDTLRCWYALKLLKLPPQSSCFKARCSIQLKNYLTEYNYSKEPKRLHILRLFILQNFADIQFCE